MKALGFCALALIVGYLLGGWAPRTDIYALERRIENLNQRLSNRAFDGNPSIDGITRMLNVPEAEAAAATAEAEVEEDDSDGATPPDTGEAVPAEEETNPAAAPLEEEEAEGEERTPESFEKRLEQAAELWGIRSDVAREGFLQRINANDEQTVRFDVLVEAMNVRIETTIAKWAEVLQEESMPPREAAVRMMNDVTGALVLTYDEMNRSMPVGWDRDAGRDFQLVDFVDPYVATPLIGLENKLQF